MVVIIEARHLLDISYIDIESSLHSYVYNIHYTISCYNSFIIIIIVATVSWFSSDSPTQVVVGSFYLAKQDMIHVTDALCRIIDLYYLSINVNVIQFYQSTTDASSSLLCRRDSEVAILPTPCHAIKASSSSSSSSSSLLSCHCLSHLSSSSPVHGRYSVSLLWL